MSGYSLSSSVGWQHAATSLFYAGLAAVGVALLGLVVALVMDRTERRTSSVGVLDSQIHDSAVQRRIALLSRFTNRQDPNRETDVEMVGATNYVRA